MICFVSAHICTIALVRAFIDKTNIEESNFDKICSFLAKFNLLFVMFFVMVTLSGLLLVSNSDFKFADPMINATIVTLWVLASFIVVNFLYIIYKFKTFKKALISGDTFEASEHLIIIVKYFIPLNLAVSVISAYLCVVVCGF